MLNIYVSTWEEASGWEKLNEIAEGERNAAFRVLASPSRDTVEGFSTRDQTEIFVRLY